MFPIGEHPECIYEWSPAHVDETLRALFELGLTIKVIDGQGGYASYPNSGQLHELKVGEPIVGQAGVVHLDKTIHYVFFDCQTERLSLSLRGSHAEGWTLFGQPQEGEEMALLDLCNQESGVPQQSERLCSLRSCHTLADIELSNRSALYLSSLSEYDWPRIRENECLETLSVEHCMSNLYYPVLLPSPPPNSEPSKSTTSTQYSVSHTGGLKYLSVRNSISPLFGHLTHLKSLRIISFSPEKTLKYYAKDWGNEASNSYLAFCDIGFRLPQSLEQFIVTDSIDLKIYQPETLSSLIDLRVISRLGANSIDPITIKSLRQLTRLEVRSSVQTPIDIFNNLRWINLKDLSEIHTLKHLHIVSKDLSNLEELSHLTHLVIDSLEIDCYGPIKHLKCLERLRVKYCNVNLYQYNTFDLEVLECSPTLRELSLIVYHEILNINKLRSFKKLKRLCLPQFSTPHINDIAELPDLRDLSLIWSHESVDPSIDTILKFTESLQKLRLRSEYLTKANHQVISHGDRPQIQVPQWVFQCSQLQELDIFCKCSYPLDDVFGYGEDAGVLDISQLKSMTSLRHLAWRGRDVINIQELTTLTNLETLKLNADVPEASTPLSPFPNLPRLRLLETHRYNINIDHLADHVSLHSLIVNGSGHLTELPPQIRLLSLCIKDTSDLMIENEDSHLFELIYNCNLSVSRLPFLRVVEHKGGRANSSLHLANLPKLSQVEIPKKLREFDLINLPSLHQLPLLSAQRISVQNLQGLTKISIKNEKPESKSSDLFSPKLENTSVSISSVPLLSSLTINDPLLTHLEVSETPNLATIDLSGSSELSQEILDRLCETHPALTELELRDVPVASLKKISTLKKLEKLELTGPLDTVMLKPLSSLSNLKHLSLAGCRELRTSHPFLALASLTHLDLSDSPLLSFDSIEELTTLTELQTLELCDESASHSVMAQLAINRGDVELITKHIDEWITSLSKSSDSNLLAQRIARAVQLSEDHELRARVLKALSDALMTWSQSPLRTTWDTVLSLSYSIDGAQSVIEYLKSALSEMFDQDGDLRCLHAALDWLNQQVDEVADEERAYLGVQVQEIADPLLQSIDHAKDLDPALLSALILCFTQYSNDEARDQWNDFATQHSVGLEEINLRLARWQIQRGAYDEALRLLKGVSDAHRDRRIALEVRAKCVHQPVDEVQRLDELRDKKVRLELLREFFTVDEVLASHQALINLMLIAQESTELLNELVQAVIDYDPEHELLPMFSDAITGLTSELSQPLRLELTEEPQRGQLAAQLEASLTRVSQSERWPDFLSGRALERGAVSDHIQALQSQLHRGEHSLMERALTELIAHRLVREGKLDAEDLDALIEALWS